MCRRADLLLVGDETQLGPMLSRTPDTAARLRVVHAADVVSSGDPLIDILRRRPDTSMRRALALLSEGAVDGVVSAGDTAALLGLSRLLLEMVPGIERPAICKAIQGMRGPFWMLDLGANLDCSSRQLAQFGAMGATLARHAGGVAEPRVALLNVGTEEGKGPEVLHEAARLLRDAPGLSYVGYIEGNALFEGVADVVVCNGFAGNIALKSIEGAARMAGHLLTRLVGTLSPLQKIGLALSRSRLQALRGDFNPQRYNGASFVGLGGTVVKSHGGADAEGFAFAIEQARAEVEAGVPQRLAERVASGDSRPFQ
jgi:glycerol-3-phosphate acyltransferase PlsX